MQRLTPPPLADDPISALFDLQALGAVTYATVTGAHNCESAADTEKSAMRFAGDLAATGRAHLVQCLLERRPDGVGVYAYVAIAATPPKKPVRR